MVRLTALLTVLMLLTGARVFAQAPASAPRPDELVAKALVDQGIALMEARRFAEAQRLFDEAVARDPQGPQAPRARALSAQCAAAAGLSGEEGDQPTTPPPLGTAPPEGRPLAPPAMPPPAPGRPVPSEVGGAPAPGWRPLSRGRGVSFEEWYRARSRRRGRVQVTIALGVWGLYAGAASAARFCDDEDHDGKGCEQSMSLGVLLGPGMGVALGLLLSSPASYTEGEALATVAGMWWGFWNGLAFAATKDHVEDNDILQWTVIGSTAGIVAGALMGLAKPTTGQVALANSFAAYAAFAAALFTAIGQPEHDGDYGRNAIIAADVGLVAGYLVGGRLGVSRARAALLDVGALAGAGAGATLSLMFMGKGGEDPTVEQQRFIAGLTVGGMVAGVIATWVLTARMQPTYERRLPSYPALLARDPDGWGLGTPTPLPVASVDRHGRRGVGAAVSLVGGTF